MAARELPEVLDDGEGLVERVVRELVLLERVPRWKGWCGEARYRVETKESK